MTEATVDALPAYLVLDVRAWRPRSGTAANPPRRDRFVTVTLVPLSGFEERHCPASVLTHLAHKRDYASFLVRLEAVAGDREDDDNGGAGTHGAHRVDVASLRRELHATTSGTAN